MLCCFSGGTVVARWWRWRKITVRTILCVVISRRYHMFDGFVLLFRSFRIASNRWRKRRQIGFRMILGVGFSLCRPIVVNSRVIGNDTTTFTGIKLSDFCLVLCFFSDNYWCVSDFIAGTSVTVFVDFSVVCWNCAVVSAQSNNLLFLHLHLGKNFQFHL